jgi:hypothetical protein
LEVDSSVCSIQTRKEIPVLTKVIVLEASSIRFLSPDKERFVEKRGDLTVFHLPTAFESYVDVDQILDQKVLFNEELLTVKSIDLETRLLTTYEDYLGTVYEGGLSTPPFREARYLSGNNTSIVQFTYQVREYDSYDDFLDVYNQTQFEFTLPSVFLNPIHLISPNEDLIAQPLIKRYSDQSITAIDPFLVLKGEEKNALSYFSVILIDNERFYIE